MVIDIRGVLENGAAASSTAAPLVAVEQPIEWPKGADGFIRITVVDPNGAPVNLTGMAVAFGLRAFAFDAAPVFAPRAATLSDPTNGVCIVPLVAADTSLLALGDYRCDVWLTNVDGRHQIVRASSFELVEADVLPSESPTASTPISPVTNGAVDTVNTTGTKLSAVDASLLTDGFEIWVREKKQMFHIEIGQGYTVDHSNYETALGLTGGQWVNNALSSALALVKATTTALSAVPVLGILATGQDAFVTGNGYPYKLVTAIASTPDGSYVLATADDATRQWVASPILERQPTFVSDEIDLTVSATYAFGGNLPRLLAGKVFIPLATRLIVTAISGVFTVAPQAQVGSNGTINNIISTTIPASIATLNALDTNVGGGPPVGLNLSINTVLANPDLSNAVSIFTTAATGTGPITFKGRVMMFGLLTSFPITAP